MGYKEDFFWFELTFYFLDDFFPPVLRIGPIERELFIWAEPFFEELLNNILKVIHGTLREIKLDLERLVEKLNKLLGVVTVVDYFFP